MLPGSTGRFYKDDVAHNHSAHGYYITPIDREEFDSMIRLHVKQNKTKLLRKKLQVRGTPCKCCSRSQQRSSPGFATFDMVVDTQFHLCYIARPVVVQMRRNYCSARGQSTRYQRGRCPILSQTMSAELRGELLHMLDSLPSRRQVDARCC